MVPLKVIPAYVTESGHTEDCQWDGAAASSSVDPVDSRRLLGFSTGVTSSPPQNSICIDIASFWEQCNLKSEW